MVKSLETLARTFVESHPKDAAKVLETFGAAEALGVMDRLPSRLMALLFERLTPQKAGEILDRLDSDRVRELLSAISPRQAAMILQYIDSGKREDILASMTSSIARQLRELLVYPPETAGGMMEPRVASIPADLNVQAATAVLRKAPR